MHRQAVSALLVAAAFAFAAPSAGGALAAMSRELDANPCVGERDEAGTAIGEGNDPDSRSLRRRIDTAFALYRLHRLKEAGAQLDGATRRLSAQPRPLSWDAGRIGAALDRLRSCIAKSPPPPLATVNVRTFRLDGGTLDALGARGGAGIYVRVDDIPIGRTTSGGILRAQVPSGAIRLTAVVPSTAIGEQPVTLEPRASQEISIGLDADGDVIEETDLTIREAHDGVLRASASSLTLQFTNDDQLVRIKEGVEVELLNPDGDVEQALSRLFTIKDGAIVAANARAVIDALPGEKATSITLRVHGVDALGFTHGNDVAFRVK
jgi:hypothetical protein